MARRSPSSPTPAGPTEAQTARDCFTRVRHVLEGAGVRCVPVSQDQVLAGALDERPVAVIPYGPNLSADARAAIKTYCGDGGRLICFFIPLGLEQELGLRSIRYVPSPKGDLFRYVRFRPGVLPGLPDGFPQNSWNVESPDLLPGTQVLADWLNAAGQPSGHAAATLCDGGMFFTHILLDNGPEAERTEGLMLRAAVDYLAARAGRRCPIAIVRGTLSERAGGSDSALVPDMVQQMGQMLEAVGLPHVVLTDEAVERGALRGRKVAILPLNFRVSDVEAQQVRRFVTSGGRLIGCFSTDARLLPLMGVSGVQFRSGGQASPYQVVHFNASVPAGFRSFAQASGNVMVATPAADGTVAATWQDRDGTDTGCPAVVLSPTGMYFSYILMAGDVAQTSRFVLAGIAHLAGTDFYALAVRHAAQTFYDLRRCSDRDGFLAACGNSPAASAAVALEQQAQRKLDSGDAPGALDAFDQARAAAERALIASLPSRGGRELRGVWLHSPYVDGDNWDAFFDGMRHAHLNAFFPNVCNGAYAHYASDVLPLSPTARRRGGQIQTMLAAARRHGIEVHLWRVDFNLLSPGREVVDRLAREGRICLDPKGNIVGGPDGGTLCPSNPQNQQLEVDAVVEMAVKFHPDGVQFDYIRYPDANACFCSGCRQRFEQTLGRKVADWPTDVLRGGTLYAAWNDFRRAQIDRVVRDASERVRKEAPGVKVSADVFSNWDTWARDGVAQDWPMWTKQGWLDFACPMDYTQDVDQLARTVAKERTWVGPDFPLEIGLGAWVSPGAWHLADLVDTARANGADGLMFFQYSGRVVTDLIPPLLEGPLREDARSPWAP